MQHFNFIVNRFRRFSRRLLLAAGPGKLLKSWRKAVGIIKVCSFAGSLRLAMINETDVL
jgi:hypothetical protein